MILVLEHFDNYQAVVSVSDGAAIRYVRIKNDVADTIRDIFLAASAEIQGAFNSLFEPIVETHDLPDTEITGQGDLIKEIHLITSMRGH